MLARAFKSFKQALNNKSTTTTNDIFQCITYEYRDVVAGDTILEAFTDLEFPLERSFPLESLLVLGFLDSWKVGKLYTQTGVMKKSSAS